MTPRLPHAQPRPPPIITTRSVPLQFHRQTPNLLLHKDRKLFFVSFWSAYTSGNTSGFLPSYAARLRYLEYSSRSPSLSGTNAFLEYTSRSPLGNLLLSRIATLWKVLRRSTRQSRRIDCVIYAKSSLHSAPRTRTGKNGPERWNHPLVKAISLDTYSFRRYAIMLALQTCFHPQMVDAIFALYS